MSFLTHTTKDERSFLLQKEIGKACFFETKLASQQQKEMASTALEGKGIQMQTCILKVHINCMGCIRRVKKLLRKVEGVFTVDIDEEEQKVLVTGMVDPAVLVRKLVRSGKHAEVWSVPNEEQEQAILTSEDKNNNIPGSFETQMLPDIGSKGDSSEHKGVGTKAFTGGPNGNLSEVILAQNTSINRNYPPNLMSNFQTYYPSYMPAKTMPMYYCNLVPAEMNIYREDGQARHHMHYDPMLDNTSS